MTPLRSRRFRPTVGMLIILAVAGLSLGRWYADMADGLTVAVTEKRTKTEIDGLAGAVKAALS